MESLKQGANCIGINSNNFSVLRHFFGFFRGTLPPDPTGADVTVSLKKQLGLLEGDHFHVNVIAVGVDNFTDSDDIEVDYSIFKLRNVYDNVGIGVGRVEHYGVDEADADGLHAPTTKGQLEDITDKWVVWNNGIDLFIPSDMNVSSNGGSILGRSAVDGPCEDKDDKGMNGSVSGLWGDEQTARTVAHELGHYLTLEHRNSEPDNLMCQSGKANSIRDSVLLTNGQGNDCKDHCMTKPGC